MRYRSTFDIHLARSALSCLGSKLGIGPDIEILIIGGAAGHLIGVLPPTITTSDIDAIEFVPPGTVDEVLSAAELAASDLQLPPGWLNHDDAGLYAHALPAEWKSRRVFIGRFGRLTVHAIARRDLIAMKFYAHREVDLEHLHVMKVQRAEIAATRSYLNELRQRLPDAQGKVDLALHLLATWGNENG